MSEGMLHIRDVEGPKKTGSMETRLEAMEQQVFKCQGMVERGLNANHTMITEFTSNHKMDAIDIGKHLSRLYDRVDQLQGQIYDLQNQNCEYEYRFKSIRESRATIAIPVLRWIVHQGLSQLLNSGIVGLTLLSKSLKELSHSQAFRRRRWRWNIVLLLIVISS
ncbi:40s ribosomal protein s5-1 [Hordeum vulgare]|nr:40s ribosomal protein s5-1 [Hordeum vulgare]